MNNYIDIVKKKFDEVYQITLNYLEQLNITEKEEEEKVEKKEETIHIDNKKIKKEYVKIFKEEIEKEDQDGTEDEVEEILDDMIEDVIEDLKKMKIKKKRKRKRRRKKKNNKILEDEKIDKDMWYNQSFVNNDKEKFNFYK